MRLASAVALLTLASACGTDDPILGEIAGTVTHYDYTFDVTTRRAHSKLEIAVEDEGDCITLPFRAIELDTASARWNGELAATATSNDTHVLVCGRGVRAGTTLVVETDQTVPLKTVSTSQVGYSVTNDSAGNPFSYLVSWVGGCDRFGPCDSRPDKFATYTFHVTHADTLAVSCPGTITEVSATETTCEFTHGGGPTYSTFGLATYPKAAWTKTDKGMWGSVHAVVYDRATTMVTDDVSTTYNDGFVRWLEQTFGPYPYGSELRIYTAPTYWSGFEHPGNIVLDDGLARTLQPAYVHNVQHILGHEIVHQWAGDQTTLADTYDFVWKEAMAEYVTFAYEDMVEPLAARGTASYWKRASAGAMYFPVPGEKPPLFDYYGDVYGPGPMILFRQLEVLTSRQQVLAAIASVLGSERTLSVDQLVAALSEHTGLDLTGYAAAWIHGTGAPEWPVVNTQLTPGTGTSTLHITQTTGQARRCKFHIALEGQGAGERQLVEVDTFRNGIDQTLSVPTPAFTVTKTTIDPDFECLVFAGTTARQVAHPWLSEQGLRTFTGARHP